MIYTDNSVSVEQLRQCEMEVLNVLQGKLAASTAHSFLQHFNNNFNLQYSRSIISQATGITALASTEYKYILTKQSVIAAAALAVSVKKLKIVETEELVLSLSTIVKCQMSLRSPPPSFLSRSAVREAPKFTVLAIK